MRWTLYDEADALGLVQRGGCIRSDTPPYLANATSPWRQRCRAGDGVVRTRWPLGGFVTYYLRTSEGKVGLENVFTLNRQLTTEELYNTLVENNFFISPFQLCAKTNSNLP